MEQPAKIRRSSSTTVMAIAILVGGVGLTWWAWNGGGFLGCLAWPLAVAALVLGALMLLGGLLFGGEAKCPSCGEVLDTLLTTSKGTQLVSCPKCTDFARVQGGTLSAVPADAVDEHHVFGTKLLGPEIVFEGCIECGAPATRTHELTKSHSETGKNVAVSAVGLALAAAGGPGFVRTGGGGSLALSVPYCDAHDDAVRVRLSSGQPVLCFRSLSALRRFSHANSVVVVVAPPAEGDVADPS